MLSKVGEERCQHSFLEFSFQKLHLWYGGLWWFMMVIRCVSRFAGILRISGSCMKLSCFHTVLTNQDSMECHKGFCFTLPYFQLQDLLLVQISGEKTTWDVSEKTPASWDVSDKVSSSAGKLVSRISVESTTYWLRPPTCNMNWNMLLFHGWWSKYVTFFSHGCLKAIHQTRKVFFLRFRISILRI